MRYLILYLALSTPMLCSAGLLGDFMIGGTGELDSKTAEAAIEQGFRNYENSARKDLPIIIDADTQTYDITVGPGPVITFWNQLVNQGGLTVPSISFQERMKRSLASSLCSSASNTAIRHGGVYRYNYVGNDNYQITMVEVSRRDCGF